MTEIKVIIAHKDAEVINGTREVVDCLKLQNATVNVVETPKTINGVYGAIKDNNPHVVIIDENLYTSCINYLCDKCVVFIITTPRRVISYDNIFRLFYPVKIDFLQKSFDNYFGEFSENDFENMRMQISEHLASMPGGYAKEIDEFCAEGMDRAPYNNQRAAIHAAIDAEVLTLGLSAVAEAAEQAAAIQSSSISEESITRQPVMIAIHRLPLKLSYPQGAKDVDLSGGIINLFYDDGSEQLEMSAPGIDIEFDSTNVGQFAVKLTYMGFTTMFPVTITKPQIIDMRLINKPDIMEYYVGEIFEPQGMVIEVIFDNGSTKNFTTFPELRKTLTAADTNIMVDRGGVTVEFDIVIHERLPETLSIETLPNKIVYVEGCGALDLAGCTLNKTLYNGKVEIIPATMDMVRGFNSKVLGKQKVTLSYKLLSCEFEVDVISDKIVRLEIVSLPYRKKFTVGDIYDLSGLAVRAVYASGKQVPVEGFEVNKQLVEPFDRFITVSYMEQSVDFPVQVYEKVINSLSIAKPPSKTAYFQGDTEINVSGGEILIEYNTGEKSLQKIQPEMVSGFDCSMLGPREVTVSYGAFSASFEILVVPRIGVQPKAVEVTPIVEDSVNEEKYVLREKSVRFYPSSVGLRF